MSNFNAKLTLDEIKSIEINILSYVASLCEKHNLRYFLAYGTLIGAIRHKGFIPWDDDIDIAMPRDDYNRLLDIMRCEKGKYDEKCGRPHCIQQKRDQSRCVLKARDIRAFLNFLFVICFVYNFVRKIIPAILLYSRIKMRAGFIIISITSPSFYRIPTGNSIISLVV